jgi:hypothetical protein
MDQSPLQMMINPKSLEKAQSELGTRMKRGIKCSTSRRYETQSFKCESNV